MEDQGNFWWNGGVRPPPRSNFASLLLIFGWPFDMPKWAKEDKEAKRLFIRYRLSAIGVALMAVWLIFTQSHLDLRLTLQPKITTTETGNTLIVTDNFTAIIMTKEFLDTHAPWVHPVPPSGYWTPKVNQVLLLESKLEEYVSPLQKPFLNTKDTKATKEIQEHFKNVESWRRLS